ncbi:unnamed protein product, partial [Medioppia subpectinata]
DNKSNKSVFEITFEESVPIGSGGFGEVYKVRHIVEKEVYAVKIVKFLETYSEDKRQAILKEVQNLVKLRSEYVVNYRNSWLEDNHLYIQMDFYTQTLQTILDTKPIIFRREPEDPMEVIEYFICCEIFRELLESVQYLHELCSPVIHRDLKPQNVMIDQNNNNNHFIKLCDFGLATDHMNTSIGHTSNVGTHAYMAPELHQRRYNNKVDIYSLGVIAINLFELFDSECHPIDRLVVEYSTITTT